MTRAHEQRISTIRAELEDCYELRDRTATLAGRTLHLTQVSDLDALVAKMDVLDDDERIPYWAEFWPSSFALADLILTKGIVADQDVIEVGCGLGLVGLCAALSGARVLLTDYDPDALLLAELNLLQNGVVDGQFALMDWRTPHIGRSFDTVLAADVLYERRSFEPVLKAVQALLRPTGTAWIAEPNRAIAKEFFENLQRSATFSGQRVESAIKVPGEPDFSIAIWQISFKLYAG
jgi:predicted nicotinamide N-methyase